MFCQFDCAYNILILGKAIWSRWRPLESIEREIKSLHIWAACNFSIENAHWFKSVRLLRFITRSDQQGHLEVIVDHFTMLNWGINQIRGLWSYCYLQVFRKSISQNVAWNDFWHTFLRQVFRFELLMLLPLCKQDCLKFLIEDLSVKTKKNIERKTFILLTY